MKKQTFISILILVLLFLGSCKSIQETSNTETVKETIKENIVSFRDTIFEVPAVSTGISIPLETLFKNSFKNSLKDSLKPFEKVFKQSNGRAQIRIKVQDGQVKAECECDSIALRAQIKSELQKNYTENRQTIVKEKKIRTGITGFQLMVWCFGCFCFGAAITYVLKTIKII
jgi:PBP1b-binding outer membrane lipoprotein LpoB